MNTTVNPKTVALMIDGDNAPLSETEAIIQFCKGYGTLRIKKAFGDWNNKLSSHKPNLINLGVKCVQQAGGAQNAVDFRLAMDAAVMLHKNEANIYVIVSSDNGFATAYDQIRQKGAKVIGIGRKSQFSRKLRKASKNEFYDIEDIIEKQSQASTKSTPKTNVKSPAKETASQKRSKAGTTSSASKFKPATMRKLLIRSYKETSQPLNDGWVLIAQLRQVVKQLDQHFDQRFAGKRISTWLKEFPDTFEVDGDRVRMKDQG